MNNSNPCQLYMSNLEPYMDEQFLFKAFSYFSEIPKYIKVLNKYGDGSGYCFVHFPTEKAALVSLHKLNGKVIPNSNPPIRFRLSHGGPSSRTSSSERDFSLWVGDLSQEVDDYQLYKVFSSKYHSIRSAKVMFDSSGFSKGYAFVKFGNEDEQKHCLSHMNGYSGLGSKPIKVSAVGPKTYRNVPLTPTSQVSELPPPCESNSYWRNYAAWSKCYYDPIATAQHTIQMNSALFHSSRDSSISSRGDDLELIDHSVPMDVIISNRELIERDFCFWDALEASKWLPLEKIDD